MDAPQDRRQELRRQLTLCRACGYCDGYCDVFPAAGRAQVLANEDLTQLASLCHNCRGCYYSCQYAPPHAFGVNLPAILAEVRSDSWDGMIWLRRPMRLFQTRGLLVALVLGLGIAAILSLGQPHPQAGGSGLYRDMSHAMMVTVFVPAFLAPIALVLGGIRRYLRSVDAGPVRLRHIRTALIRGMRLDNLSGGHGQGCNFERQDRFSDLRRKLHWATVAGFLLCFAATMAGAIMHYAMHLPAPYGLASPPKFLGATGGVLLSFGAAGLGLLKLRADRGLGDARVWGGELAFILLLLLLPTSGFALWAASGSRLAPWFLGLHLGSVLTFFLLLPYSKMVHGAFRLSALIVEAQRQQGSRR
ncbi:4Fe-4S ferredoxin [Defluviimonas sp. 20V17]|uniref:Citrate/tricarballylate utilization protein n=1 Tax=Allgaiera indica TaxID=765699 RepID=A0AAN5A0C4_9RHOB|nr:tricarballylate utilization 4Fe-4S protein TcuB [Allgaiera indica]KDB01657.1 4Fe-4S ferredoxin [Defluviimonas sp. 20V17]GHE03924.1 tricarballylate utilization protein B [Allgaiera indica]SDX35594.1 citrate/tricarballylate utilization protein [Allgaiera indica]